MSTKPCGDCHIPLDALHIATDIDPKITTLCRGCAVKRIEKLDDSEDSEVKNLTNEDMDYQIKGLHNGTLHFWKVGYVKKNIDEFIC